uniref:ORF43f n=1 Tax=Pinus koraiensis TaxID=88728 RepID=A4QM30_PINKO|nr:ORF43f [Pinus koraiensis]
MWVVIEEEDKFIPTGVRATIRSIVLQQQEELAKFYVKKRVDMR